MTEKIISHKELWVPCFLVFKVFFVVQKFGQNGVPGMPAHIGSWAVVKTPSQVHNYLISSSLYFGHTWPTETPGQFQIGSSSQPPFNLFIRLILRPATGGIPRLNTKRVCLFSVAFDATQSRRFPQTEPLGWRKTVNLHNDRPWEAFGKGDPARSNLTSQAFHNNTKIDRQKPTAWATTLGHKDRNKKDGLVVGLGWYGTRWYGMV